MQQMSKQLLNLCPVPPTGQIQKILFIVFEMGDINFFSFFFNFACCLWVVWAAELIHFGIKLFFGILSQVVCHLSTNLPQIGF